jgi:glycerol-3-phosphate dehydrogenase
MRNDFDIAVIGGGVVGLAILRRFAMSGLRCVLLERGADILSGASKGNSALLHTGFDAPTGSLELACMQAGYEEYLAIRDRLNLPLLESAALVVAWTAEELAKLPEIVARAHRNGVRDVEEIGRDELRKREPHLSEAALGAVLVPREHIIDPWSAPLAYAHQALAHGAEIRRNSEVTSGAYDGESWQLATAAGNLRARVTVNAAGNFGDLVEAIARPSPFTITPRRGQFVVFDKPAATLAKAIILPVPTERTKGVVLFRTIFGNLAIGPTAEDVDERDVAACDQPTLERLRARAIDMVPELSGIGVTAIYAGLRPASERKDYIIEALPTQNWITVGGIRSTGLTAALGIARHVAELYEETFDPLPKAPDPIWTPAPNLAEHLPRPYMDGGEVVCHCELVTRQEIQAALSGALPAGDMNGLKRRTRATMGRCQGFYCSANVAALYREAVDARS